MVAPEFTHFKKPISIPSYNISIDKSTVFCFSHPVERPCGSWAAKVAQFACKRVQWMPKAVAHHKGVKNTTTEIFCVEKDS